MQPEIIQYDKPPIPDGEVNFNEWHLHTHQIPLMTFALFPPIDTIITDPISSVAIKYFGHDCEDITFRMKRPSRHSNLRNAIEKTYRITLTQKNSEMGFIDPRTNKFMSREEAMQYVLDIGQIRKGFHWDDDDYVELHSEDVWPDWNY